MPVYFNVIPAQIKVLWSLSAIVAPLMPPKKTGPKACFHFSTIQTGLLRPDHVFRAHELVEFLVGEVSAANGLVAQRRTVLVCRLGDLGGRFPSSDERYANFNSARFIAESARLAREVGWLVDHVDATIIAQKPRLAAETPKMVAQIKAIPGLENSSINVKITSTDHVGAIGAGEGIAAQAIATLTPRTFSPLRIRSFRFAIDTSLGH